MGNSQPNTRLRRTRAARSPLSPQWIAGVKAPFNPIAAYYQDQAKARNLSNSATALLRDGDWQGLMDKLTQQVLPAPRFAGPLL